MKKRNTTRTFLAGFLAAIMMMTLIAPAGAALVKKTIEINSGVSIYVDGVQMRPTDVNGDPVEVFIYGGTTYVPIRAVSQYLGKAVKWDGGTRTVYIGEAPGEKQYLLDVCPPYQTYGDFVKPEFITMAGSRYKKGFRFDGWHRGGFALFNLNAQYKTLEFDVGHIDGEDMAESNLYIYLDGELAFELELNGDMMPKHCALNLNNAIQMKIILGSGGYDDGNCYALGNITVQ